MNESIKISCLAAGLALLAGCGGGGAPQSTAEVRPDPTAEAKRTITPENMDHHLEALDAEISADEDSIAQ